jgi:hypothetical protein
MANPIYQLKQHPGLLIFGGVLLLLGAAVLTLSGNVICLNCQEGSLIYTIIVMLCTNLWVVAAPFGLLMLTCGLLGEYCRLRQHLPG